METPKGGCPSRKEKEKVFEKKGRSLHHYRKNKKWRIRKKKKAAIVSASSASASRRYRGDLSFAQRERKEKDMDQRNSSSEGKREMAVYSSPMLSIPQERSVLSISRPEGKGGRTAVCSHKRGARVSYQVSLCKKQSKRKHFPKKGERH